MIADLDFGRPDSNGVRPARFVPRASIPLGAACLVANGVRETLRELFGERCELTLGEPVTIDRQAWQMLSADAYCFLTCGRQTDIVLVVPAADARVVVQRAFGEVEALGAPALSALEIHALERIATRCAATFDPLYAERSSPTQRLAPGRLPTCIAFFDVRVTAPVTLGLGIGIVRELPDPGIAGSLPAALLARVPVEVHVEFAAGSIDGRTFLNLVPGQVVPLATQVGAPASLKIADAYIATGIGGMTGDRYSLQISNMRATGARS